MKNMRSIPLIDYAYVFGGISNFECPMFKGIPSALDIGCSTLSVEFAA